MQTIGVIEARNRFGEFLDAVQREPVTIAKNGRPVAVMVSVADYERFEALEEALLEAQVDQALESGFLGAEESAEYLKRLLRAES
jgi:prevent-host-death family protein